MSTVRLLRDLRVISGQGTASGHHPLTDSRIGHGVRGSREVLTNSATSPSREATSAHPPRRAWPVVISPVSVAASAHFSPSGASTRQVVALDLAF
uniref:Uncharacterized protein n=1 Tax=Leersia perrieri TaxID=77586 RepID=A0A0D9W5H0_9ORYZ